MKARRGKFLLRRACESLGFRLRVITNDIRMRVAGFRPAFRDFSRERPQVVFLSHDPRKWKNSIILEDLCTHADVSVFLVSELWESSSSGLAQAFPTLTVRSFERIDEAVSALTGAAPSIVVIEEARKYATFLQKNWRHRVVLIPYSVFLHKNSASYGAEVLEDIHAILSPFGASDEVTHLPSRLSRRVTETGLPVAVEIVAKARARIVQADQLVVGWAPHWSIGEGKYATGTLLSSAEVVDGLAAKYPYIRWMYRPHPILEKHLKRNDLVGIEEARAAIERFVSRPNVETSHGEPATFLTDVDALIHDSVAFLAEFPLTSRPMLYLLRRERDYSTVFSTMGLRLLESVESCYGDESAHLCDFIARVQDEGAVSEAGARMAKEMLMPRSDSAVREVLLGSSRGACVRGHT